MEELKKNVEILNIEFENITIGKEMIEIHGKIEELSI